MTIEYFAIGTSILSILFALVLRSSVKKEPDGDEKMKEIAEAIREGSGAFLKRQFKSVLIVGVAIALLLWIFLGKNIAIGFIIGALASSLAAYLGMKTAVMANSRVAEGAKSGLKKAFSLAFKGGAVTGFLVVGLGLLVVAGFWNWINDLAALVCVGFGGSLISVFSRLGGGIYTKAADVGADLVGKTEVGIPEDDPRNPAVIADLVGDNVGDCAGIATDLFETYAVTLIAAMILGHAQFTGSDAAILYPLLLGALAIWASVIGFWFVRISGDKIMRALYKGLAASGLLAVGGFYWAAQAMVANSGSAYFRSIIKIPGFSENYFKATLVGLSITFCIVLITEYYTSKLFRPVKSIAQSSESGHGTNIITGLAVSLESTALPALLIAAGSLTAFVMTGNLYGVALASVAMLSMAGMIVAIDSFGPITDNAGGIAEMAGLPEEVRDVTDSLDAVGNTTKAVTKGYAIASAGLASMVLFAAYTEELAAQVNSVAFELSDPFVVAGLFIGGMLPYLFGSLAMRAVGKTAGSVVQEVRRQFKEISGIMEGKAKPDYARTVDIETKAALRQMILPTLLTILAPVLVAMILGPKALGGLLIGVIVTGFFVA